MRIPVAQPLLAVCFLRGACLPHKAFSRCRIRGNGRVSLGSRYELARRDYGEHCANSYRSGINERALQEISGRSIHTMCRIHSNRFCDDDGRESSFDFPGVDNYFYHRAPWGSYVRVNRGGNSAGLRCSAPPQGAINKFSYSSLNAAETGRRAARIAGGVPPTNPIASAKTIPHTSRIGVIRNAKAKCENV